MPDSDFLKIPDHNFPPNFSLSFPQIPILPPYSSLSGKEQVTFDPDASGLSRVGSLKMCMLTPTAINNKMILPTI